VRVAAVVHAIGAVLDQVQSQAEAQPGPAEVAV